MSRVRVEDNLARYSDGHAHCFSIGCGYRERGDGTAPEIPKSERRRMDLLDGAVEAIPLRGLTRDTADKFGYKVGTFRGFKAHIATYHDAAGRPVAQKVRWKEDGKKQFTWIGDPKAATLYGQNVWRDAGKMVVVTEGELDALAVSQVQNNRWPVVSIPNGAGGAAKDLAKQVAWLERFEKIILCFDMDEPGRQAVEACTKLFTPGKVFDCRLPLKDACDMVKAHRSAELVDAIWGAKSTRPDGIKSVTDLREKAMEPTAWGLPWPWRTLTERTYGIQRRYVYSWGAGVGSGKTTLQKQLMLTAMRPELLESHDGLVDHLGQPIVIPEPRKVGTILFEENPAKTLRSLAGMALGLRLNKPDVQYDRADLAAAIDSFDGLFFPLDMFGARDWDTVKSNVLYLILAEGVKDIFIDPLTALVANVDDERRALDDIMAELSGIAEAPRSHPPPRLPPDHAARHRPTKKAAGCWRSTSLEAAPSPAGPTP